MGTLLYKVGSYICTGYCSCPGCSVSVSVGAVRLFQTGDTVGPVEVNDPVRNRYFSSLYIL